MSKAKEFDPTLETWDRFVLRLQHSLVAEKITDTPENSDQRRSILCQAMGIRLYNRYLDVVGTATAATQTFDQIVNSVKGIVQPAPLEISERFKFAKRRQLPSEMPSEYLAALRQMALSCSFAADDGEVEEKRLRDQFVFGLASEEAQRYLLQQSTLTLSTAANLADQFTRARETAALLQENSRADVNKIKKKSRKSSSSSSSSISSSISVVRKWGPCSHCGESHNAFKCKFRDVECHQCGKKGHIKRVCRSGRSSRRTKVKAVTTDDGDSSEDEVINYVGHIDGSNSEDEINYGSHIEGINSEYWDDVERQEINNSMASDQSTQSGHDGQGSHYDQLKRGKDQFRKGPVDVNESGSIKGTNSKRKSSSRSVHHHSTQATFGKGTQNSIVSMKPIQGQYKKNETKRNQSDQSIRSSSLDPIHAPVQDSIPVIPVSGSGMHPLIAVSLDNQSVETRRFSSALTHELTMEPTTIKEPKPPPSRRSTRGNYGIKTDRSAYHRKRF